MTGRKKSHKPIAYVALPVALAIFIAGCATIDPDMVDLSS